MRPSISVVTTNYNGAAFLEHTIKSVLDQQYTNLEYIIIDGGSTDGSQKIIEKYESQLTYWESENDRGFAHAYNKGFSKASGEIFRLKLRRLKTWHQHRSKKRTGRLGPLWKITCR